MILCALLAGLVGCGDGGGSDVEPETEVSTELEDMGKPLVDDPTGE